MPEKPHNFWQELKRRKVVRVVIGYAAAAYVLLELTSIISEPLGLPIWTINFVLILLCIGFVITVVVSWIYDFTPKGIEKTKPAKVEIKEEPVLNPVKRKLRLSDIIISVLLVTVLILLYPKIFKRDTLDRLKASGKRISVAVMPFQNMTNDTVWNIWQNGIQINLITSLSNTEELKVKQTETINDLLKNNGVIDYASLTPSVASSVSEKLDTDIFIYGSINQAGSTIRVNMQLMDSETEEIFKSYQIDGSPEKILNIIDSISSLVQNFLVISRLEKDVPHGSFRVTTTTSPEAYRYFINGQIAFYQNDFPTAVKLFSQALEVDSNFIDAAIVLSYAYYNQNLFEEGKRICLKVYAQRDQMSFHLKIRTNFLYSIYFETPNESIACLKQMQNYDDQIVSNYFNIAQLYYGTYQYDKAIPLYEKCLKLYNKWDLKPTWSLEYIMPALSYHKTNQYDKEKKLYRMAEREFPDDPELIYNRAILELTIADTVTANEDIRKYISVRRDNLWPEVDIISTLALMYSEAGILDKAEEYYRKAAAMQQDNPGIWSRKQINNQFRLNNLAWFLIDKNRNINEGLELVNKELELKPDDYLYLDCKGWGLFKQGKYDEALKILEKSWELKPVYDHDLYLHLEAAKKAVADQNEEN